MFHACGYGQVEKKSAEAMACFEEFDKLEGNSHYVEEAVAIMEQLNMADQADAPKYHTLYNELWEKVLADERCVAHRSPRKCAVAELNIRSRRYLAEPC